MREDGRLKVQGDPTEAALIVAAEKGGLVHADTQRTSPRVDMIPFESEHMFRATLHDAQSGRVIYKIGAVERLLDGSSDALGELGKLVHLDKKAVDYAANSNGRPRPSRNCIGPPLHNREPHQARTR